MCGLCQGLHVHRILIQLNNCGIPWTARWDMDNSQEKSTRTCSSRRMPKHYVWHLQVAASISMTTCGSVHSSRWWTHTLWGIRKQEQFMSYNKRLFPCQGEKELCLTQCLLRTHFTWLTVSDRFSCLVWYYQMITWLIHLGFLFSLRKSDSMRRSLCPSI